MAGGVVGGFVGGVVGVVGWLVGLLVVCHNHRTEGSKMLNTWCKFYQTVMKQVRTTLTTYERLRKISKSRYNNKLFKPKERLRTN